MAKLIITAAITGSVHIPTMSDYLPLTPDQIIEDAVKAHAAGAAIAHIHVRLPENGMPSADPALFREVCGKIKARCDIILLPTTGGGANQTIEEKLVPIKDLKPEMCSFDPAPFNMGMFQLAERFTQFKYDWEKMYLEYCKNFTFAPSFAADIEYAKTFLETGTKPEFEMYELGHIGYVTWLMEQDLIQKPPHLQFVFGPMVGWMPPSVKHLVQMYEEAVDRLGAGNFTWSVAAAGRHQIPLAAVGMALGAPNIRVGLEDSLYAGKGKMATSSAEQVKMAVNVAREMSLEIATPDEARQILGLKGIDKVNY
ncbi:MAG: 3-keto-5-aminohexanoate cleavage protein [Proteobacteria bacterium]|nr:3-keto-5-aminohexanoate cleavage protein [Pseudomonadota bacterium]